MIVQRGYQIPDPPLEPDDYDVPRCPCCGNPTDTLYRNEHYEIVGCDNCLKYIDAWDWAAEQEDEEC